MFGFVLLVWIYLHDIPRGSDEDLRIQVPVEQSLETAAPGQMRAFLKSLVHLQNLDLAQQPPWAWDTPSLSRYIAVNGTALDNLRDLLENADWHPHHSEWHAEDLSSYSAWPHARLLLQAQAAYLARRGDEQAAFTAALDLAELSRRMIELWAWPAFIQRAQELHTACTQTTAELLANTHLNCASLRRFQDEFTRCQPTDDLLQGALNAIYIHEKKLLLGVLSGERLDTMPAGVLQPRPGRLFLKVNETLALFAEAFRELKNEVARPTFATVDAVGVNTRRSSQGATLSWLPNAAGERYFAQHISPCLAMPGNHALARARHALVLTLFALRCHVADHQRLPADLHALRPNYLLDIPLDPFSGEPLRYDTAQGQLYSVGTDLIDAGGKPTQPPLADAAEPTVRLGIATARPVGK